MKMHMGQNNTYISPRLTIVTLRSYAMLYDGSTEVNTNVGLEDGGGSSETPP